MYRQLNPEIEFDEWYVLGYYTYRSAQVVDVVCNLPMQLVEPVLKLMPTQSSNHTVYHLMDTNGKEFYIFISDDTCKLAKGVVGQDW